VRVVVTGGSGLIGSALRATLAGDGHDVTTLVRRPPGPGESRWDPARGEVELRALESADAVVHLAGAGIGDRRWTPARRDLVLRSRVASTTLLCRALAALDRPPSVLVSASAIGYYGYRRAEEMTETSEPGTGFQAQVCTAWERATAEAERAGIRVVHLRSAVVLSRHGGALARQLPLFRAGLGGRLGSGDQWLTWISLRDEVAVIVKAMDDPTLAGPLNACAPNPVTNRQFTKALGRALHRPTVLPVPSLALRLALGRALADELPLGSLRVTPTRLLAAQFPFRDPTLDEAVAEALR
jgi:uncharacterized protein